MIFLLKNKIAIKNKRIISFPNDCQGVNFTASPKQPQSVTLLKYAEQNVRKVKKTIIASRDKEVNFGRDPINTMTPNTISAIHTPAASKKE